MQFIIEISMEARLVFCMENWDKISKLWEFTRRQVLLAELRA